MLSQLGRRDGSTVGDVEECLPEFIIGFCVETVVFHVFQPIGIVTGEVAASLPGRTFVPRRAFTVKESRTCEGICCLFDVSCHVEVDQDGVEGYFIEIRCDRRANLSSRFVGVGVLL
jgi:hypothetical protein